MHKWQVASEGILPRYLGKVAALTRWSIVSWLPTSEPEPGPITDPDTENWPIRRQHNPSCLPLECVVTAFLVCELKVCLVCHWSRVKETSGAGASHRQTRYKVCLTVTALWMSFIARHRGPVVTSLIFVRTARTFSICTNPASEFVYWL